MVGESADKDGELRGRWRRAQGIARNVRARRPGGVLRKATEHKDI